jgi:hypothetical protein
MSEDLVVKKRVRLIRQAFGDCLLDRDGINVAIPCVNKKCSTFSKPHKKKLCLRVDNEFYHCWVCGLRGKGLARFFRYYAPRYASAATSLFEKQLKEQTEEVEQKLELPAGFKLLAQLSKYDDPDLKACRNYALQRGLTEKQLWYFRMGAVSSGSLRRRVIVPSFDDEGFVNYFTARSIDKSTRKYVNPKIKRSEIIFNEININWNDELVLVEGPFDLIKSTYNSTCLLGSTLAEGHALFNKIVKNRTPVILALDPDARRKTQKIADLLLSFDVDVKVLDITPHDDIGEMPLGMLDTMLASAKTWTTNDKLLSLISTIKTGSIL